MKRLSNQSGFITADFIFAFVLVMGFSAILFTLCMTMVAVEVTQYLTYASARTYHAAHFSVFEQERVASAKFAQVFNYPAIRPLFSNGWFELGQPIISEEEFVNRFPEYRQQDPLDPNLFIGVGTDFNAKVLNFQIPFYGPTTSVDQGDDTFRTFISSYLGREPTSYECRNFTIARWAAIRQLRSSGSVVSYSSMTSENGYVPITDDGC